jgi:hypothetical protein
MLSSIAPLPVDKFTSIDPAKLLFVPEPADTTPAESLMQRSQLCDEDNLDIYSDCEVLSDGEPMYQPGKRLRGDVD